MLQLLNLTKIAPLPPQPGGATADSDITMREKMFYISWKQLSP